MAKTVYLRPKSAPKFKYNINKFLGLLPRSIKIGDVIKSLETAGIPAYDFYRHRSIPTGSTKSMSEDALRIYASFFDCTIDELVNDQVNVKSVREMMGRKSKTALR